MASKSEWPSGRKTTASPWPLCLISCAQPGPAGGRGQDVLVIDGDEQGSAATFAEIRAEIADKATFATIRLQGVSIRQQMKQLRDKYDEIVAAHNHRYDPSAAPCGSKRGALCTGASRKDAIRATEEGTLCADLTQ